VGKNEKLASSPSASGTGTISGQGGKIQSAKAFNAKYVSSLKLNSFLSQKPAFSKKKRSSPDLGGVFLAQNSAIS